MMMSHSGDTALTILDKILYKTEVAQKGTVLLIVYAYNINVLPFRQ